MGFLGQFLKRRSYTTNQKRLEKFIYNRFGYRVKTIAFFEQAVTHKSHTNGNHLESNERLEFLGDAIIDSVVADFLFHRFPTENEGHLTKIKSKMVSRKTLSDIAEEMELRKVLNYHKGRSININTLEGNAFEALIGAIYLDGGYNACKKAIKNFVFNHYIDVNKVLEEEIDFKSKLFIWAQKNKALIDFEIISEENFGSYWEYKVLVTINEKSYGMGIGASKKIAEQGAAKQTLELFGLI